MKTTPDKPKVSPAENTKLFLELHESNKDMTAKRIAEIYEEVGRMAGPEDTLQRIAWHFDTDERIRAELARHGAYDIRRGVAKRTESPKLLEDMARDEVSKSKNRYVLGEIVLNDIANESTIEIIYNFAKRDKNSDIYYEISYFLADNKNGNVKPRILEDIAGTTMPRDTHGTPRKAAAALHSHKLRSN